MEIIEGPAGFLALAQDPLGVTQQQVASLGELGLAATTVEQRHIQLLLQVLNLETDGWLGDIKAVRSLFETALACDGAKDAELIEGKREVSHFDILAQLIQRKR